MVAAAYERSDALARRFAEEHARRGGFITSPVELELDQLREEVRDLRRRSDKLEANESFTGFDA